MIHTVVRGDSLSKIARKYGVSSWRALYDAPENAAFRAMRPNPNLIYPGDRLQIPARTGRPATSHGSSSSGGGSSSSSHGSSGQSSSQGSPSSGGNGGNGGMSYDPSYDGGMSYGPPYDGGMSYDPSSDGGMCTADDAPIPQGSPTDVGKEPDVLTVSMLRDVSFVLPFQFVRFLCEVFRATDADARHAIGVLSQYADGASGVCDLYTAYRYYQHGDGAKGTASAFKGLASVWKALPSGLHKSTLQSLQRALRRIPKFAPVADMLEPLDRCGGISSLLMLLSSFISGDARDARSAANDFVDGLRKNPGEAARMGLPLVEFFGSLIPERTRAKLLAKMAGRKIPVAGTIVVGITDIVSIWSEPGDWTRWAGLGSTLVALVPVAGTALSFLIDLGVLLGTIVENINDLSVAISHNPFQGN